MIDAATFDLDNLMVASAPAGSGVEAASKLSLTALSFNVNEGDQGEDLNGDGDETDSSLHVVHQGLDYFLPGALLGDDDGDGVDDVVDNCLDTPNTAQLDADGDGVGDACEPPDSDGDGVSDGDDNCAADFNPLQSDVDGDGLGDVCDACPADATDLCEIRGVEQIAAGDFAVMWTDDFTLRLEVPENSLAADVTVSATSGPVGGIVDLLNPNPGIGLVMTLWDLKPDGLQFLVPASLTVFPMPDALTAEQTAGLGLYYFDSDPAVDSYVPVPGLGCSGGVEDEEGGISELICEGDVSHFTRFAVLAPADTDGDGIFDLFGGVEDNCPNDPDPDCGVAEPDADADGVPDGGDNCVDVANPAQSDIDGDLFGDVCDICPSDNSQMCDPGGQAAAEFPAGQGGQMPTMDGNFLLEVDVGALGVNATISASSGPAGGVVDLMASPTLGLGEVIAVYNVQVQPDDVVFEPPVKVTIAADVQVLSESQRMNLAIYQSDEVAGGSFEAVGSMCQVEGDIAICTALFTHFSDIALITPVDTDGDGVFDLFEGVEDNCQNTSNADQFDFDGDQVGDACDDSDGDGAVDAVDNCRELANPGQADFNGDGEGDVCDDSDGDGVLDAVDNCRDLGNSDQTDTDGDLIGDACDPDDDGDGIADGADRCASTPLDQTQREGTGCSKDQLCALLRENPELDVPEAAKALCKPPPKVSKRLRHIRVLERLIQRLPPRIRIHVQRIFRRWFFRF